MSVFTPLIVLLLLGSVAYRALGERALRRTNMNGKQFAVALLGLLLSAALGWYLPDMFRSDLQRVSDRISLVEEKPARISSQAFDITLRRMARDFRASASKSGKLSRYAQTQAGN